MKKNTLLLTFSLFLAGITTGSLQAQNDYDQIRLWKGGQMIYTASMEQVDSITFVTKDNEEKPIDDQPVEITLSKTSVRMAITVYDSETSSEVANTDRFTITPKDGTYEITTSVDDIVTWKISKNTVTLTAQNLGKTTLTITETKSKATATLEVEIVSVLESLSFTQATVSYTLGDEYLAKLDTVDSVFTWTKENGEQVALRAFLVDATINLFSDGFFINDNGEYAGPSVGYIATFPAKAWFAPEGMNADRGWESSASISTGVWSTQAKTQAKVLTAGTFTNGEKAFGHVQLAVDKFNEYIASDYEDMDALKAFQDEMYTADTMAFHGAQLIRMMYMQSSDAYSYDFMPAAIITEGAMQLAYNDKSMYMYNVPAIEMKMMPLNGDNGWGVKVEQNEITNQYNLLSTGFEFGEMFRYRHTSDNNDYVPARKAKQFDRHVLTTQPKNVVRR
ncbi:MAG: hypothetical protein K5660_08690 [Paludibacteraceae bacterium]|nr:hypothetical protein [Paludibacteraceae bacterium]